MSVAQSTVSPNQGQLFRHTRRPDWGLAVFLWEHECKRGYQFSDGKVRVFKQGYYELFSPAAAPGDGTARAVRRLARVAGSDAASAATTEVTFREQVEYFHQTYDGGFSAKAWTGKHRGMGQKRRLKRHRQAAVNDAGRLASIQDDTAFLEAISDLLESTDLLSIAHARSFRALGSSAELAAAMRSWLYEEGHDKKRFERMVAALGSSANWSLATAVAALVHPREHVCVHVTTMRQQAKIFFPDFKVGKKPTYKGYRRYQELVRAVFDELTAMGETPRDLLDVRDFMWLTQRPSARREMRDAAQVPAADVELSDAA
jgi:hypothetical protein